MGFEPTIVSLEDAKRKGLNDLVESVQLDVMDLLDGQNLTYLNASHRIIGGGGYEFRYKFSISHCNTTQYHCNTVNSNNHCITVKVYRTALVEKAVNTLLHDLVTLCSTRTVRIHSHNAS